MMYGHIYVAQVVIGAQMNQTVKAIQEAATLFRTITNYRLQPL